MTPQVKALASKPGDLSLILRRGEHRDEELAQWLRALLVLAEDLGSVPSAHRQLTTISNSSSKKFDAPF